jgi:chemotaxis protein methyltransferase CheR
MVVSTASFAYIRALLADRAAIELDKGKAYLVETRLLPIARAIGCASIDELVARLRVDADEHLRQQVVDAMTTNETSFFRDEVPFDVLRATILPDLLARRANSRTLNVWSAGCASGQEPYSVAMLWREHFSQFRSWTFRLLATDLSAATLAKARCGEFTQLEVQRGLPLALLHKYFHATDRGWQIDPAIRQMVEFRQLHLGGDWPPIPRMDLILLRNVLVYFDAASRQQVLGKVHQVLRPDGYLLLGGAESAVQLESEFEVLRGSGFSYYRPRGTRP